MSTAAIVTRGAGRTVRRRARGHSTVATWKWALPGLLLVFVAQIMATVAGGYYAFTDWNGFSSAEWVGVSNFAEIFTSAAALRGLGNTLLIGFGYVVGTMMIGLLFALAFNRLLKSRHLLRAFLFAPAVLSPLAVSYVWKFIFDYDGPLNQVLGAVGLESWQRTWLADPAWSVWVILFVVIWQGAGLPMIIFLAGLAGIPQEIEEAAVLDGAQAGQRFRSVTLPYLAQAGTIAATLMLIQGLRIFDPILALTGGGPAGASDTLASLVYKDTFVIGRFGYGAALSLVLTAVILVCAGLLFLVTSRARSRADV